MTFQIFVGYGDQDAKRVAEGFGGYLGRFGLNSFVASTNPRWMLPGYTINSIYKKLAQCDVLVPVCTGNTTAGSKLGREIRYAHRNKMLIVPFLERGIVDPFGLSRRVWKMEFDLTKPWVQHRTLATYILHIIEKSFEARCQGQKI